jgi:hypothetical protein
MDTTQLSPIMKLAITLGALWAAYKFGPPELKGMALGAAGIIALNQVPIVREGANVRLLQAAA